MEDLQHTQVSLDEEGFREEQTEVGAEGLAGDLLRLGPIGAARCGA